MGNDPVRFAGSHYGNFPDRRYASQLGQRQEGWVGQRIEAAAGGTVTYSGSCGDGYGNYVVISHGNGVTTLYAHCSQLLVKAGQTVSQGEVIAKVGSTGNSSGNHLHLEVRKNGVSYDPQNYVY